MQLRLGGVFQSPNLDLDPARVRSSRFLPAPTRQAIRAFLAFLGIYMLCIVYGYLNFYRDPGSIFFDESKAFVRWYSAYRQSQAEAFITRVKSLRATGHNLNKDVLPKAAANASVCATFLTVTRKGVDTQYLDNSIASLLDRLTPEERRDINLKVFFADVHPEYHPTWHEHWVRDLVDEIYTYSHISPETVAKARELDAAHDPFKKSPWDYAIPMKHCYDTTTSPYIAVFEDDIMIAEGMFAGAMLALREVQKQMEVQNRGGKWMYLRLFNQERSTGWRSRRIGGNSEFPISLALGTTTWAVLQLIRSKSRQAQRQIDGWTAVIICCVAIPAFVILFFQCGRASLLPPSPGLKEEFFGCCAQGLIYNREHVPGLTWLLQLQDRPEGQDLIVVDYAAHYKLARFSLYPMSIQHMGAKTTIQADQRESRRVWSMAFENLNPEQLCQKHRVDVQKLYGVSLPSCS